MPNHQVTPCNVRKIILEQSKRANVGHIGSCLSIVEIIVALFRTMQADSPDHPDRDRLILSKGHAALALYAALHLEGHLDNKQLNSFHGDGTLLGVHPEHHLYGVDFSTGSLGQGLPMGVGAALAAKLQKSSRRTFVVISDAECNEGSVWEAAMFASHHQLSQLVVILDDNGQQAFGYAQDVLSVQSMRARWESFGWAVHQIDGHNVESLSNTITSLRVEDAQPHLIIAKTVFGKGVSFMENQIKWHYWPMSDDEYAQAYEEICETTS